MSGVASPCAAGKRQGSTEARRAPAENGKVRRRIAVRRRKTAMFDVNFPFAGGKRGFPRANAIRCRKTKMFDGRLPISASERHSPPATSFSSGKRQCSTEQRRLPAAHGKVRRKNADFQRGTARKASKTRISIHGRGGMPAKRRGSVGKRENQRGNQRQGAKEPGRKAKRRGLFRGD